jgi:general stress protein YciG
MDFKRLQRKARQLIDRRGGTTSLKEDAEELRDIAKRPGSASEKVKRAADALKEPGAGPSGRDRRSGQAPMSEPAATDSGAPASPTRDSMPGA